MRRKLNQIQNDSRDSTRRRAANDHVFVHALLTKRHQWFNTDKTYRDTCRSLWNRQSTETGRTSHIFLPSIYPNEKSSQGTMSSYNHTNSIEEAGPAIANERIKQNFLNIQPVMLEILYAPHSSQVMKHKQHVELRKTSAYKRQAHIQTTATNDDRFTQLVDTLDDG